MGATKMFTPYDLRPTVEITAFSLTAISTLVVAIRYLHPTNLVYRSPFNKNLGFIVACGLLDDLKSTIT